MDHADRVVKHVFFLLGRSCVRELRLDARRRRHASIWLRDRELRRRCRLARRRAAQRRRGRALVVHRGRGGDAHRLASRHGLLGLARDAAATERATRSVRRRGRRGRRRRGRRRRGRRGAHHGIGRRTGGRTYDAALRDGLRWRRCMPRRIRDAQGRRPAFVRRVSRSVRQHASRARQTGGRVSSPERGGQTRQTNSAAPALVRRRLVCHGGAPVRVRPGSAHTRCVQRSAAAHDAKKKRRGGLGR